MFESAEIAHAVSKSEYEKQVPALREALLEAQFEMRERQQFAVVVVVAGVDGAGKGDTVNLLNWWLDPRHVRTLAMGKPKEEEKERPALWRFWRSLPPRGNVGIFFGSWYTDPILRRAYGKSDDAALDHAMERIRRFEDMLAHEGTVLLKLWFHLSKDQQRKRLSSLEQDKRTRWRVSKTDWKHFELYDTFVPICARSLRQTSTDSAPWTVVAGAEPRYRQLTVGNALLTAIRQRIESIDHPPPVSPMPPPAPAIDGRHLLTSLEAKKPLRKKSYKKQIEKLQRRLNLLTRDKRFKDRSVVAAFEGWDAGGKGGAIRRLTAALDARIYHVVPVGAPTDEEAAQPYLWRFWRHVPGKGDFVIFDRTWYGRVLVERVEGFCSTSDWMRAYSEINDFEESLIDNGSIVTKLWLHITPDEQLRRFREREKTGFKRHKITDEDWRNREKWSEYELAVTDMIDRTSTEIAPWTLVEANDKLFARVKVLRTVCDRVEAALRGS